MHNAPTLASKFSGRLPRVGLIAALVIALDWTSKLVAAHLVSPVAHRMIGPLGLWLLYDYKSSITYVPRHSPGLLGVQSLLVVAAVGLAYFSESRFMIWGAGIAIGGIVGNAAGSFFVHGGGVVDFIYWQNWCIFNLADVAIMVGCSTLVLTTLVRAVARKPLLRQDLRRTKLKAVMAA